MIWVPISRSSRGSIAFTLPCVPTDMKTGVSTTPCVVVNRPRRALELASVLSSSNIAARVEYLLASWQLHNSRAIIGRYSQCVPKILVMASPSYSNFQERVVQAAESALKRHGSVGPLELFQEMLLPQPSHLEGWRKGNEYYRVLESWIQVGPEKFQKAIGFFQEWASRRGLRTIEADYTRRGLEGIETMQVTADGDPAGGKVHSTAYRS